MRLVLPPVFGLSERLPRGQVDQLIEPAREASGQSVRFVVPSASGWLFTAEDGETVYVFPRAPRAGQAPAGANVLQGRIPDDADDVDLSDAEWISHVHSVRRLPAEIVATWSTAFQYLSENEVPAGKIGLRNPQIGALHAIHAHWSTSADVATVVMPTGTGKTETMIATLVTAKCRRLLVVVPTDALRLQVFGKFSTLGILRHPDCEVLNAAVARPIVGLLKQRPSTAVEVEDFFNRCNVVVTTSALIGGCVPEVQSRMAEVCTHLFIDEAHHAEAPTWKEFKSRFKSRGLPVLQFTATPFREDGVPLDGKIIYVYPLRMAQREGYFREIQFRPVYAFSINRADRDIASKVIEELRADATGRHVAMARVSTTARATEVLDIYLQLGQYQPIMLHSSMPKEDQKRSRRLLANGEARIVVCVDMLGEGFDMPELKIAAFHDLRKSLAVTLQLAGRFTRARADLGNPVFIANTADVNLREELRTLYSQDPDWNLLLPGLSEGAIEPPQVSWRLFGLSQAAIVVT